MGVWELFLFFTVGVARVHRVATRMGCSASAPSYCRGHSKWSLPEKNATSTEHNSEEWVEIKLPAAWRYEARGGSLTVRWKDQGARRMRTPVEVRAWARGAQRGWRATEDRMRRASLRPGG